MDINNFSLVVLAGGKSSRMGQDKCDLLLGNRTFLEHQIEKGKMLGIQKTAVSGYKGERCSVPVVPDRYPGRGPLAGLEACFRMLSTRYALVLSVDVPLVPLKELERLMEAAEQSEKKAVILSHGGHEESLIAVYETDLADEMETEILERKGSVFAFLNRIGYDLYEASEPEKVFTNINDPDSYRAVLELNDSRRDYGQL